MDPILAGKARLMSPQSKLEPIDYEEKYVFLKEISPEYKCTICSKLMREPQVTECCGQHFCQHCMEQWLARHPMKKCPHCRTGNFNYIRYLPMKREINELQIYCKNRAQGCISIVSLEEITEHIAQCDFEQVTCVCNSNYCRKDLTIHQQFHCPNRLINCQYCQTRGEYRIMCSDIHYNHCPDYPVNCPRGCGTFNDKRKNLENHRQVCPLELVNCQFTNVGCKEQVQRKDYDTHMKNNTEKHLQFTVNYLTQLSTMYNTLQSDHERLKNDHEKLKNDHAVLTADHDALKKKHAPPVPIVPTIQPQILQYQPVSFTEPRQVNSQRGNFYGQALSQDSWHPTRHPSWEPPDDEWPDNYHDDDDYDDDY